MLRPSSRAIAFCLVALTGCGGAATVRLDSHHPASPDGPEAVPRHQPLALVPDEFDRAVVGATTGVPTEHSDTAPATDHEAPTHSHHTNTTQESTPAAQREGSADSTARRADEPETVTFVCPMHPEVIDTTASKCPKCGMRLVPKEEHR